MLLKALNLIKSVLFITKPHEPEVFHLLAPELLQRGYYILDGFCCSLNSTMHHIAQTFMRPALTAALIKTRASAGG